MSQRNSAESSFIMITLKCNVGGELEVHVLTWKEVHKQIRNKIAPLTKKLEDLTRLIKGLATAQHSTLFPGACTSAISRAFGFQPATPHLCFFHLLELMIVILCPIVKPGNLNFKARLPKGRGNDIAVKVSMDFPQIYGCR